MSSLVELKDEEDGVDGNACDVTLQFESELGEGSDILNGGDFVKTGDGGGGLEFVCGALYEADVQLALIGGAELETVGLGDHLHRRMFELDVGTFRG